MKVFLSPLAELKLELLIDYLYVKINAHIDFNGMGSTEGFIPYTIPIDSTINVRNNGAYIGARQSRIGFRSEIHSPYGKIETYIEGDFAEPTANVFRFRLRHAYGKIGYWTIGHTWTTFMDLDALPKTVDIEGPNSSLLNRHGLIRYNRKINENFRFAASFENPEADFVNAFDSLEIARQSDFDLPVRAKWTTQRGHLQLAGIGRVIRYFDVENQRQNLLGWGIAFSGRHEFFHEKKSELLFQVYTGEGISNYVTGLSLRKLDAFPNFTTGQLDLIYSYGWYAAYQLMWNEKLGFNAMDGQTSI